MNLRTVYSRLRTSHRYQKDNKLEKFDERELEERRLQVGLDNRFRY
jgi:hypothetical protein